MLAPGDEFGGNAGRAMNEGDGVDRVQVVVMGVSGSGKTTVGERLAAELGVPFVDGDALHPPANVAKMASGVPLTDEDRGPWLRIIGETLAGTAPEGVVVACSALKRAYRDLIRAEAPGTAFAELDGSRALLAERMAARPGHFMPVSLLDSQLATLEPLQQDEAGIRLDVGGTPEQLASTIAATVRPSIR